MVENSLEDLPPSAKLVYKVLEYNGALTQKEIVARSKLSQRTARDAIGRLQEIDAVTESVYIRDARQNLYELSVEDGSAGTPSEGVPVGRTSGDDQQP